VQLRNPCAKPAGEFPQWWKSGRLATQNANKQGDRLNGLAARFQATCSAADDPARQLGHPQEAMIKVPLDFLAGRACTPIPGGGITAVEGRGAGADQEARGKLRHRDGRRGPRRCPKTSEADVPPRRDLEDSGCLPC
jgi:hypothetical protein